MGSRSKKRKGKVPPILIGGLRSPLPTASVSDFVPSKLATRRSYDVPVKVYRTREAANMPDVAGVTQGLAGVVVGGIPDGVLPTEDSRYGANTLAFQVDFDCRYTTDDEDNRQSKEVGKGCSLTRSSYDPSTEADSLFAR